MKIGYKLTTEAFGPVDLVEQAVTAERLGFDFVEAGDHFHPWLDAQGHAANTWVLLGAVAARTDRIGLVTGVTCPSFRYHPALVAQQAATLQMISGNRFTLGVGSGERINEHVTGRPWPDVRVRHEYFREALEIIRLLWRGGYRSYRGTHLQLSNARIFDLPDELPELCVAVSGKRSVRIARELGDGLFAIAPEPELVTGYVAGGGTGPRYADVQLAWARDEETATRAVVEKSRFVLTGWPVLTELPDPAGFAAATATVSADDVKGVFACGPDVDRHVAQVQKFADAGFDHLVLQNAGPDPEGFFRFWSDELQPRLRGLAPGTA